MLCWNKVAGLSKWRYYIIIDFRHLKNPVIASAVIINKTHGKAWYVLLI